MKRRAFAVAIASLVVMPTSTRAGGHKTVRIGWVGGWYSA